jgi:demethylmenaquinone methyltransferase/2-methoxy-6-polyprenyl-1,4-benzoquinol methylase
VLRPGGRAVLLEVSEPDSRVLHALHTLYFRRIVPIVGGALSDAAAYRYLPASTSYLPQAAALLRMFRDAGFDDGRHVSLTGGAAQLLIGTRG